jgi:hypothetical protein
MMVMVDPWLFLLPREEEEDQAVVGQYAMNALGGRFQEINENLISGVEEEQELKLWEARADLLEMFWKNESLVVWH